MSDEPQMSAKAELNKAIEDATRKYERATGGHVQNIVVTFGGMTVTGSGIGMKVRVETL